MNAYRQQIIRELDKNNIYMDSKSKKDKWEVREGTFINGSILDGALYLFLPKKSLWGIYEEVAADPLPFMIFLLKLLEWKKSLENS